MKTVQEEVQHYKEQLNIEELRLMEIKSNRKTTGTNDFINCMQWIKNYKEKITELEKQNVN